jgi:hypothetical protein
MMDSNAVPQAGGLGEVRSKRIPGREDVPEESTKNTVEGITIEDLKLALVLLDACAQRGAFKIDEFSVVGKLFDKMNAFLSSQENAIS